MEQLVIKPLEHRGEVNIAIYFPNKEPLNKAVKKIKNARWSITHKCWYVGLSRENYNLIYYSFKGLVTIEQSELVRYLEERKKATGLKKPLESVATPAKAITQLLSKSDKASPIIPGTIHFVNAKVLPAMKQSLVLKSYSASTIKTYMNEVAVFLRTIGSHPAEDFSVQRLKDYLQYCAESLGLSENTLHSRMNALKFYYEQVLRKEKLFWDIPRPKKPMLLPKLLNESELVKLFNALINKKHKAMLFTAYSAGLRVSEIVNLKLEDIDSRRMQIFVQRAKGKKDRYVNLSPVLLDILRSYIKEYKPSPEIYLFESEQTGKAYPTRTVQQIFTNARKNAGVRKEVGIHSLRHSFATHLLDKGTDIRYIKDILGHFNIKTTERYLHVSKQKLVNIMSPFDDLWKTESIDW